MTQKQGNRFDVAFEASYDSKQDWLAYGFTQLTGEVVGHFRKVLDDLSRAVRTGPFIAVTGCAAVGPDGQLVGEGDAYVQAVRCIEVIGEVLEKASATPMTTIAILPPMTPYPKALVRKLSTNT